jgi:hypothetical protein
MSYLCSTIIKERDMATKKYYAVIISNEENIFMNKKAALSSYRNAKNATLCEVGNNGYVVISKK